MESEFRSGDEISQCGVSRAVGWNHEQKAEEYGFYCVCRGTVLCRGTEEMYCP